MQTEATTARNAKTSKFLTFALNGESYGVDVQKIREIIRPPIVTAVPQLPPHMCGVINLRGNVIPVMDLRVRLGISRVPNAEHTCFIVVMVKSHGDQSLRVGLVVDRMEEVVNLAADDIEPAPDFGAVIVTDFILGMAKIKGVVTTLLDIDKVVGATGGPRALGPDVIHLGREFPTRKAA